MTSEAEKNTSATDGAETVAAPAAVVAKTSPGELLARGREAKGLSVAELAAQTRLARATLESLEKNDFGSSKPVFVRGYFRKCARALDISEEELIGAYAAWTGTPLAPEPLAPIFVQPPEDYSDPRSMSGLKYWIAAGILIGVALWWFGSTGQPNKEAASESVPATSSAQVSDDGESRTLTLQPPSTLGQQEPAPAASGATVPSTVTSAAPAAVPENSTQSAAASSAAVPATADSLDIRVERVASWVEIYDADNKRLVYDLLQPGTQRQATGRPPYQIILGNPDGITLAMGGRPIDLKPYTSPGGTARLTLNRP